MTNNIVVEFNKIAKLNEVNKVLGWENIYKIYFTVIEVCHYLRRENKQYEYSHKNYVIYIPVPESININEQKAYVLNNWSDYIKEVLKSWHNYEDIFEYKNLSDVNLYTPYMTTGVRTKAFNQLFKLFRSIVMKFDIQPSLLNFTSCNGYQNESGIIDYSYVKFKEDIINSRE